MQGQIIVNKLKKEKVAEHAVKLQEQFNILEGFLTSNKFIAGDNVKNNFKIYLTIRYRFGFLF